jgi:hypothetical protein
MGQFNELATGHIILLIKRQDLKYKLRKEIT